MFKEVYPEWQRQSVKCLSRVVIRVARTGKLLRRALYLARSAMSRSSRIMYARNAAIMTAKKLSPRVNKKCKKESRISPALFLLAIYKKSRYNNSL